MKRVCHGTEYMDRWLSKNQPRYADRVFNLVVEPFMFQIQRLPEFQKTLRLDPFFILYGRPYVTKPWFVPCLEKTIGKQIEEKANRVFATEAQDFEDFTGVPCTPQKLTLTARTRRILNLTRLPLSEIEKIYGKQHFDKTEVYLRYLTHVSSPMMRAMFEHFLSCYEHRCCIDDYLARWLMDEKDVGYYDARQCHLGFGPMINLQDNNHMPLEIQQLMVDLRRSRLGPIFEQSSPVYRSMLVAYEKYKQAREACSVPVRAAYYRRSEGSRLTKITKYQRKTLEALTTSAENLDGWVKFAKRHRRPDCLEPLPFKTQETKENRC